MNEQINWTQRFFIPTDETIGMTTLSRLLTQYPLVVSTEAETAQAVIVEASNDVTLYNWIDPNEWIIDISNKRTVDEFDSGNDEQPASRESITTEQTLSVTSFEPSVDESQQQAPTP